jgi:hypothetical protein
MKEKSFGALTSPEEMTDAKKMDLEEYIVKGYELLYDKEEALLKLASQDAGNKVESVANAAFLIGMKVDQTKQQEGGRPFPDDVKVLGGVHMVEKTIQLAEHAGVAPFTDEEKAATLQTAFQKYIQEGIKNRTIDPTALAKAVEEFQPGTLGPKIAALPDGTGGGPTMPAEGAMPGGPPGMPGGAPVEGAMPGGPPAMPGGQPQGLIAKASPLEGFINGQF